MEEYILDIVDQKHPIIQLCSIVNGGKTNLSLMLANFYASIGKSIVLISYGQSSNYNLTKNKIKKLKLLYINDTNTKFYYKIDIDNLIINLEKLRNNKDVVIIIDSFDMFEPHGSSSPVYRLQYYYTQIKKLSQICNKVIFTNNIYQSIFSEDEKNNIEIPIGYKIVIDNSVSIEEYMKIFKTLKRKYVISGIEDDEI